MNNIYIPAVLHNLHGLDPNEQNQSIPNHRIELQIEVPCLNFSMQKLGHLSSQILNQLITVQ